MMPLSVPPHRPAGFADPSDVRETLARRLESLMIRFRARLRLTGPHRRENLSIHWLARILEARQILRDLETATRKSSGARVSAMLSAGALQLELQASQSALEWSLGVARRMLRCYCNATTDRAVWRSLVAVCSPSATRALPLDEGGVPCAAWEETAEAKSAQQRIAASLTTIHSWLLIDLADVLFNLRPQVGTTGSYRLQRSCARALVFDLPSLAQTALGRLAAAVGAPIPPERWGACTDDALGVFLG
jgi:hypothetical protein